MEGKGRALDNFF